MRLIPRTSLARTLLISAVLALAYFVTAKIGLRLAFVHASATAVWPPTGISIAAVLLFGSRIWPGIFLGAFLANLTTAGTAATSLGIATGNTLEALLAGYLVNRFAGGAAAFERARDVFVYMLVAAGISTTVSPLIGVTTLALGGVAHWSEYGPIWLTWWLGDAAGAAVVAPLLLLTVRSFGTRWSGASALEGVALVLATLAVSGIVFGGLFPFSYLTVPVLAWAAFRFGATETAAVIALLSVLAITATLRGLGPFARESPHLWLLWLQAFMGIMAVVHLPLAAVVAERRRSADAAERARERLQLAQKTASAGTFEWNLETDEVIWSEDLDALYGLRPGSFGGKYDSWVRCIHPDDRDRADAEVRRAAAGGGQLKTEFRIVRPDDAVRWMSATATVVSGRNGRPAHLVGVNIDVTERRRAEDGQRFLAEAGKSLAESLGYQATFERVARLAVPFLADWCVADSLEEDGTIRRLAVVHADRQKADLAKEIRRSGPANLTALHSPVVKVLRTRQSEIMSTVTDARLVEGAVDQRHLDALRAIGLNSAMLVPLVARGRILGALILETAESGHVYTSQDLTLAEDFALHAALAIDNARLYEREQQTAESLQRTFLPPALPSLPGISIDAAYLPGAPGSDVGGDWYDAFRLPDGRVAFVVGDVGGRGLQAAAAMARIRQSMRALAFREPRPDMVLEHVNRLLCLTEAQVMASVVFAVLDPVTLRFTYSNAGHPPPLLITRDGEVRTLSRGDPPLGVDLSGRFSEHTTGLPLGSLLALHTDGLTEQNRNPLEGESRLADALKAIMQSASAAAPAQEILRQVLSGSPPNDDTAILTLSIDPQPTESFDLTLPAVGTTLPALRQAVRRLAANVGLDAAHCFALQVGVGEAVTNVLEHAYKGATGSVRVWARRENGSLVVSVEDRGRWRNPRDEGRGRGLAVMRKLMDGVDIETGTGGSTVTMRLRLPPPSDGPTPEVAQTGGRGRKALTRRQASHGGDAVKDESLFPLRYVEGIPVVEVGGDVDLTCAHLLEAALDRAAQSDKRVVIVALARGTYIDSKGIHVLHAFFARLTRSRQKLVMVIPQDAPARRILDIAGFLKQVPAYMSVEHAIAESLPILS